MIKSRQGPMGGCSNPSWQLTPGSTGLNDPGDPSSPFNMPNRPGVNRLHLDAEATLIAKGPKRKKRRKSARKKHRKSATILYLFDAKSKVPGEDLLAREIFKTSRKNMVGVGSWDDFANVVNGYSSIEHLVLSFHGYEGGLNIGNNLRDVDEKSVIGLFAPKTGSDAPSIDKISFVGCNVGGRPAKMATFANLFGAKTVSGYTWYIGRQEITFELPPGNTASEITKTLKPYSSFVRPKPNASAMAAATRRKKKVIKLLIMYGAKSYSTIDSFPLDSRKKRVFKPIDEAAQTTVTVSNAKKLETEIDESPVTSFQKVTVKLK